MSTGALFIRSERFDQLDFLRSTVIEVEAYFYQ